MGNEQPKALAANTEGSAILQNNPSLTPDRLAHLQDQFGSIDQEGKGCVTMEQFRAYCGLDSSDLTNLVLQSLCD